MVIIVVKHFNVIMAGVISGIVALFTSILGISGTVIGSVLSSFLYQFFSSYSAEKYEEGAIGQYNLAAEVVFIFPLVVIGIIMLIFLLSDLHYNFALIFNLLESAVANNLFRLMGLGLFVLGVYPLVANTNIKRFNGKLLMVLGLVLFLRGMVDFSGLTSKIFYMFFDSFDPLFALIILLGIGFVIANILKDSANEIKVEKGNEEDLDKFLEKRRFFNKNGARKIDTSFEDVSHKKASRKSYNKNHMNSRNFTAYDDGNFYNDQNQGPNSNSNHNSNLNSNPNSNPNSKSGFDENIPIYEEEIIYVDNPNDPSNPIQKRILKRVKPNAFANGESQNSQFENGEDSNYGYDDGYEDTYLIDESVEKQFNNNDFEDLDYSSRDVHKRR